MTSPSRHTPQTKHLVAIVTVALAAGNLVGCVGYRFGSQTLYSGNIRTVHVPVFQSESLRPHLAVLLTEAVVKEIELKTPYKVVGRDKADTILEGRIVRDTKRVRVETRTDEPRALDVIARAEVRWTNSQGQLLCPQMDVPLSDTMMLVDQSTLFVPEVGHSVASSQQQVIQRLAQQVVGMMEVPW